MADSTEKSFTISVPEEQLDFLQKKLALSRLPDELDDAGWDYGVPLSHTKRLVEHWKNRYVGMLHMGPNRLPRPTNQLHGIQV